jgi:hypothetical protein
MTAVNRSSRRAFIGTAGAALSAPLGGLGASARRAPDGVDAIRTLLHEHATRLGATPDAFGAHERIDLAADGRTATATLTCIAATEDVIGPDCPLVEMARQQGGGVLRRTDRGSLEFSLTKRNGRWTIEHAMFRPMS